MSGLNMNTSLEELKLCKMNKYMQNHLLKIMKKNETIKILKLEDVNLDTELCDLINVLKENKFLTKCCFKNCNFNVNDITAVMDILQETKLLKFKIVQKECNYDSFANSKFREIIKNRDRMIKSTNRQFYKN